MTAGALVKAALSVLADPALRKKAGWVLVAILSPVIVLLAFLCALGTGGAEHNNLAVKASFYGSVFSDQIPVEYRAHVLDMQSAFARLDSAVVSANEQMENGNGLDPIQVKAVFYALCFGEAVPSRRAAGNFVGCFYTTETRTRTVTVEHEDGTTTEEKETYTATVPLSLASAYANLASLLGREITDDDRSNAQHIYITIAGPASGGGGSYLRGTDPSVELDISKFKSPGTKNADDLVTYAIHAWESGWGYVWGTYGCLLTESAFQYKLAQYPDAISGHADFIRANWVGGRTTDCVGLIKGYGWLNPDTLTIDYGTNGMPDTNADLMYYDASVSGPISTIPEIPGLAVWHEGHIGVYIGNGEVIEAMGTRYGVVKTQLAGRGWTHWLKIPYISYD